jgi:integrase
MARKTSGLTAKRVANLREPGRYKDPDHKGLYLQIGPTGNKSWLLRFENNGRERWMGLGSAKDFKLAEARERAREKRQLLADGIDPIDHRITAKLLAAKEARERQTFKDAADEFLKLHAKGWKNAKHRAQWRSTLSQYVFPKLGELEVSTIDDALINEAVMPIWTKTPETAKRLRGRVSRIVEWVKKGKPLPATNGKNGKHHPALPWQEIPSFMADLREREGISARALEFCILTAARTSEVIKATWDEIDLDAKTWVIPAERMKAAREHRVPLSAPVVELLRNLPREDGNPFLFIGAREGKGLSNMAMLELLRGMRSGLTVHGFRSSFKDWVSEATSTPNMVSEMALAHVVADQTEAAYRRGDLFAKRAKLMTEWSRYCASKPAEVADLADKRKATA